jgi:hypothetical protein
MTHDYTHPTWLLWTSNQLVQKPLRTQDATNTRDEHSWSQLDSNPRSQISSGWRSYGHGARRMWLLCEFFCRTHENSWILATLKQQILFERLRGNQLVKKLSAFYITGKFNTVFINILSWVSSIQFLFLQPVSRWYYSPVYTYVFTLVVLKISRSTFCTHFSFPPCPVPGRGKTFSFSAQRSGRLRNTKSPIHRVWGTLAVGVKFSGRQSDHSHPAERLLLHLKTKAVCFWNIVFAKWLWKKPE